MTDDLAAMFERMYVAAANGDGTLPWDRGGPHPLLEQWAAGLAGDGRRALVVGSGLGGDAEFLAGLGFEVIAFDASPTAIACARERHPSSVVDYRTADLLDLPVAWSQAFGLVLESLTVQSIAPALHAQAAAQIAATVAPAGTLLAIATARDDAAGAPDGPPWPLTRAEVEAFGDHGLQHVRTEAFSDPPRWRAEFRRV